jgi:hypothetical protein
MQKPFSQILLKIFFSKMTAVKIQGRQHKEHHTRNFCRSGEAPGILSWGLQDCATVPPAATGCCCWSSSLWRKTPWKPSGTRCGMATLAIGLLDIVLASYTCGPQQSHSVKFPLRCAKSRHPQMGGSMLTCLSVSQFLCTERDWGMAIKFTTHNLIGTMWIMHSTKRDAEKCTMQKDSLVCM